VIIWAFPKGFTDGGKVSKRYSINGVRDIKFIGKPFIKKSFLQTRYKVFII